MGVLDYLGEETKEEKEISSICDNIEIECTIKCDKCGKSSTMDMVDSMEAAEIFHSEGWRTKRKYTYCYKCLKK